MASFYLYLLKAVLVVLSAGKVEFPCNRSFVSFFCVDIQRWGKRRLRPHSRRAPVAHARALPSGGTDKGRVFWTVSSTRVVLMSSVNRQKILMGIICCHGLQSIADDCYGLKILRRYPKLSNYRLEMHLFCFLSTLQALSLILETLLKLLKNLRPFAGIIVVIISSVCLAIFWRISAFRHFAGIIVAITSFGVLIHFSYAWCSYCYFFLFSCSRLFIMFLLCLAWCYLLMSLIHRM